jgi:hypothetical protein
MGKEKFMANRSASSAFRQVREHAREMLDIACSRGEKTFEVNIGSVHRGPDLNDQVPLIVTALESKKFLQENGLRIVSRSLSTTITFTYEILGNSRKPSVQVAALDGLRGIARNIFKSLGGGENFIRGERKNFAR